MVLLGNYSDVSIVSMWVFSIIAVGGISVLLGEAVGLAISYLPVIYFAMMGSYTPFAALAVIHGLIHDLYPFINSDSGFDFDVDQSVDMLAHTAMLFIWYYQIRQNNNTNRFIEGSKKVEVFIKLLVLFLFICDILCWKLTQHLTCPHYGWFSMLLYSRLSLNLMPAICSGLFCSQMLLEAKYPNQVSIDDKKGSHELYSSIKFIYVLSLVSTVVAYGALRVAFEFSMELFEQAMQIYALTCFFQSFHCLAVILPQVSNYFK